MLRRQRRKFEARLRKANAVIVAMKCGATLHLQLTQSGRAWALSSGYRVDDNVAQLVTQSASVRCLDPGLFDDLPGQTWSWWNSADERLTTELG
jgi:hypothetical protein